MAPSEDSKVMATGVVGVVPRMEETVNNDFVEKFEYENRSAPSNGLSGGQANRPLQEVGLMSMDEVSLAIVKFLGYGVEPYPNEDAARIEKEFGSERAPALEEKVRPILNEFAALKPDWSRHSLGGAAEWAGREMKRRYPGLSEESIKAMSWIFTWRWK